MKDLLVITTYYDYFGSRYLLPNFERFQEGMAREGLDLVIFEAATDRQPFRLDPAPNVVQLRSRDTIWQKERMINLAIERFSDGYRSVAWIDNDILLPAGWSRKALAMMDRVPIGQLFGQIRYVLPDGDTEDLATGYARLLQERGYEVLLDAEKAGNPGTAWVARTSLVKGLGIYDRYINCGNDTMLAITVGAERKDWVLRLKKRPGKYNILMNDNLSQDHREWDRRFSERLRREKPGGHREWSDFLDQTVDHQYHGRLASRLYMDRYWILADNDFDPAQDLSINSDGLFEWATHKPDMHDGLKKIFKQGSRYPTYA